MLKLFLRRAPVLQTHSQIRQGPCHHHIPAHKLVIPEMERQCHADNRHRTVRSKAARRRHEGVSNMWKFYDICLNSSLNSNQIAFVSIMPYCGYTVPTKRASRPTAALLMCTRTFHTHKHSQEEANLTAQTPLYKITPRRAQLLLFSY